MNNRQELTEYNSANSKVYLNGDGTISVEIYDQNINDSGIMPLSDEPTIGETNQYNPNNLMISQGALEPFNITDTYISSSGTTTSGADKIKIGVEKVNGNNVIHRALLKFDLPKIPSSYTLVNATLNMIGYYDENYNQSNSNTMVAIHQIKNDWFTTPPNWDNMLNGYHESIENYFHTTRSGKKTENDIEVFDAKISQVDITDLVQRWYNGEPNYGLMLKAVDETYNENIKLGEYYTVDAANESANPQARLVINYKNLNGLEGYLTYTSQSHELGSTHINNYNGNLTSLFNIANTVGGPLPASIDLVYNTADVSNNNDYGYGLGVKPNLIQIIKEVTIDTLNVLQYLDEDGTIHYFYKNSDDNIYYDEDGLSLKVELIDSNYIMTDKNKNTNKFVNHNGTYYLEQITDTTNKSITIEYDSNNRITKVIDASNKEITITYEDNKIIFISPYKSTIVNLTNNQITSIEDLGDITTITYNDNKLIEKIINSNGLYTKYEYINDLTYKVSKVTEYGRNDSEGNYLEFTYNLKSTSIKDRKGHINTYVFNNNANTEVITSLDENQNLSNAYGKSSTYGETGTSSVNKITLDSSLVRHINNLIDDSSFESGNNLFTTSNESITTEVIDNAHYGIKALKVTNTALDNYIYLDKVVDKDKDYTFSAYIKNEVPFELSLSYDDVIKTVIIDDINSEYSRCDVTINYPEEATSNLNITIKPLALGVIYIDGLQLEEGEVANYYNMISNSNFANGLNGYEITTSKRVGIESHYDTPPLDIPSVEVVQVDGSTKALRLINSPLLQTTLAKSFYMSGKAGDVFELSFWYKNEGPRMIPSDTSLVEPANIRANLHFDYTEGENDESTIDQYLTPYNKDWHYFSKKFVAKEDYNEVSLNIINEFSCRDCYITNISLFKDLESYSYTYDDEGNLVSSTDLSRETSTFNYNGNNQLIEATSPLGNKFKYEYDENVTDRLIRAISPSGITNSIDYDENNNPIKVVINNTQSFDEIIDTTYYIRAKGTDRYVYIKPDKNLMVRQCECSHDKFNVIRQTDNKIKLQYTILNNYYLKDNGGVLKVEYGDTGNNIFELIEHSNKTYSIKSVNSNLAITVNEDNRLSLSTYDENSNEQQFLFERMESKLFIESSSNYTEDGRFIKSQRDSLGNIIVYDIDELTGLVNKITDSSGHEVNYVYDEKQRVVSVIKENHMVSFEYDNNRLVKIDCGNKNYIFEYDEFNNLERIKIGDNILVTNIIEDNNGSLIGQILGNNQRIIYYLDEFNRVKKFIKDDQEFNIFYDNLGRVVKSKSMDEFQECKYDFSNRISQFRLNDYKTQIKYDGENNVSQKTEKLNNDEHIYNFLHNNEAKLLNLNIDGQSLSYQYDKLGRLKELLINNLYKIKYNFITNGNRTSTVVSSVDDNGILYSYKYDKLGNIIEVKKGNSVTNKYYYDEHSELIKDEDFVNNKTTTYSYDNYGNILSRKTYEFESETLVDEDTYEYGNGNWQDQLTKFNDEIITYDAMGNSLTIGNKTLTWKNGRELATYNDVTNNITYKYNVDGIRTEKVVNGNTTKYHLEGTKIIFEDRNGNMLYYIYNNLDIVGFEYQYKKYYYHKNIMGDIIGIFDNEFNEIVTYGYDSWGSIISITDNSEINLARINPFRYRAYYYDDETDLYYLGTRYYSPKLKRFINEDSYVSTGQGFEGYNMFQYCRNNPIMYREQNGKSILAAMILGGLASGAYQMISNVIARNDLTDGVMTAFTIGACAGLVGGAIGAIVKSIATPSSAVAREVLVNIGSSVGESLTSSLLNYYTGNTTKDELMDEYLFGVFTGCCFAPFDIVTDEYISSKNYTKWIELTLDIAIGTGASIVNNNFVNGVVSAKNNTKANVQNNQKDNRVGPRLPDGSFTKAENQKNNILIFIKQKYDKNNDPYSYMFEKLKPKPFM